MSQENVDVVRGIWEADRRRDWDAVFAAYHDDVVWEDHAGLWGDWGVARGPDGIREAWRRWHEAFDEVRFEFGEVAHDGDVVIVTYDIHGRGRGSGVEVQQPVTLVWWLTGGKVVRISAYLTRPEALEAAGLLAEEPRRAPPDPPSARQSSVEHLGTEGRTETFNRRR